jgi:ppGpp synthetase/RelA/SpoT-type nucleotidyltranferase
VADIAGLPEAFEARRPLLQTLAQTLEDKTREALQDSPHIDRISFRAKDTESFVKKASKSKYTPLCQAVCESVHG